MSTFAEKESTEKATRAALASIVAPIAVELGTGWTVEYAEHGRFTFHGPDGAELHLSEGWPHDGKVSVSGSFKDRDADGHQFWYLPYKVSRPSIQVNPTRGAKAVAGDIKRRLLSEYLPLLAACNEARDAFKVRMDIGDTLARTLAKAVGGVYRKNRDGYTFGVSVYHSKKLPGASFDIKVNDDQVTFDRVTVGTDAALEILRVLAAHHTTKED